MTELSPIVTTLRDRRQALGISLRVLAKRTGVWPSNTSSYERGLIDPSLTQLTRWAAALGYELTLTPVTPHPITPDTGEATS